MRTWKSIFSAICVGSAVLGLVVLRPALDMNRFNFQDSETKSTTEWLFKTIRLQPPLFRVYSTEGLIRGESQQEAEWSKDRGLSYEGVAGYLPSKEVQNKNAEAWTGAPLTKTIQGLNADQRKFFEPFLSHYEEERSEKAEGDSGFWPRESPPLYLQHLSSGETPERWVSMWFPKSKEEEAQIREAYQDATSLRELVEVFPRTFEKELLWMVPWSLIGATLLLILYYRRVGPTCLALLPFIGGLGLLSIMTVVFKLETSFVSLMGLVMVFGFSIDYGIFVTDALKSASRTTIHGVWTAFAFTALMMMAGFAPLLFCKHPILVHLGQTLFYGTLGAYLVAIWGIPAVMSFTGALPRAE